jgi:hypothetical protein
MTDKAIGEGMPRPGQAPAERKSCYSCANALPGDGCSATRCDANFSGWLPLTNMDRITAIAASITSVEEDGDTMTIKATLRTESWRTAGSRVDAGIPASGIGGVGGLEK